MRNSNDLHWSNLGSLKTTLKKVHSRSCFIFISAQGVSLSIGFKMTDATFRTNVPFNARSVDVQFGSRITKVSLFRIDQSSEDRRIKIDRSNCSKMTKKKAQEGDKLHL